MTGLVSPQFHVKFDNLFQTIKQMQVKIMWKDKCHFKTIESTHTILRNDRHANTGQLNEKTLLNPESPTHEIYQTTNTTQHLQQETDISEANEDKETEIRTPVNVADTKNQQSEP
jgi:hypothetical protein